MSPIADFARPLLSISKSSQVIALRFGESYLVRRNLLHSAHPHVARSRTRAPSARETKPACQGRPGFAAFVGNCALAKGYL